MSSFEAAADRWPALLSILIVSLCSRLAYGAEQTQGEENFFKRAAKVIGHDAKTGAKQAGQAFKQLGKDIGHGSSKAAKMPTINNPPMTTQAITIIATVVELPFGAGGA